MLVVSYYCLLAEPDRALRDLMHRTLETAGYEVFETSNAMQLEVGLRVSAVLSAAQVLFVLGTSLAIQSATSIAAAARKRVEVQLPTVHVILTYEFGTLIAAPSSILAPCLVRGVLEKPFDLHALQAMALDCAHPSIAAGADETPR